MRINVKRFCSLNWIVLLVYLVHIIIFCFHPAGGSPVADRWRTGIALAHSGMFLVSSVFCLIAWYLQKRKECASRWYSLLSGILVLLHLLFGVMLCIIDQLVTSSINPYLVVSIGVAMFFLYPPHYALFCHLLALFLLLYFLPLAQMDREILLSIRANGISATAIAFGISLVMWNNYVLRIHQQRQIKEQQKILEEKNRQLQYLATYDPLTGLYNRRHFLHYIENELSPGNQIEYESSIIIMDIDDFKCINDQFGHPAGDQVLVEVASLLRKQLRDRDIAARFGGEEFVVLLPETGVQEAGRVAEKLRVLLQEYRFFTGENQLKVTASFGVASLKHMQHGSFDHAYQEADKALYLAKRKGRNRVEVVDGNS